ncbi:LPS-assembly protein LptD [Candidimonas sp. SYP-B2681]|uniref:LPS-assembly protein LptD n=1 Tax=Candidimonas sp. SYP-B2681 TaxID=2497686 RepID=UPI000F866C5A|nr:LPS-assembly protein LptD [Candidimonas sp. SYP-B2681]RTZ44738.1 LPS-assembly protein LptD [Candidimonas sp. SYP-B2681]
MRLVWWTILLAFGSATAVQAQQPRVEAGVSSTLPQLQVAPDLQLHKNVKDNEMSSFLVGDKMESDEDGLVKLTGKAEVRRIDSVVKGDYIDYQRSTGQVRVRGNGLIMRDASIVKGPELNYNINSETGEVNDANFWLGSTGGAGTAVRADILSRDHMRLADVSYTGCPCPDPSWYIKSSRVDLHFDDNEGIARNGVLYFKGMPILYSPFLTFPIRKERKSGFLVPTYGTSSSGGFEVSLPYYLNLGPNYDATLVPRYMAKRGTQLGAEFRYLGNSYSGQVFGTYLADDKVANMKRWYYSWQHAQRLGGGLSASFDIRRVSDDDYFRDFSSLGLNEATNTYLPSTAGLNWSGYRYFNASLYAYTYQTLQDRTSSYLLPQYDKLPELYVRGARYNWGGFDVESDNYATRFNMPNFKYGTHPYPFPANLEPYQSYDGTRFSSYTSVAYPIVRAGWYVTPKVGVHMSQYNTEWNGFSSPSVQGGIQGPQSQSRVLPIMSLDSGMTFEREASLFGNDAIQTFEPRLYYLNVPYRDQSQIPIYDTSLASFNFSQAFSENIFSGGWDRIAEANQVTVGLTTRWLDADSGSERLSLSAAQRIYFSDQRVKLGFNDQTRTDTKSDYLIGANAALTDTLNVRFDGQFNPHSKDRNRMTAGFRWEPKRLTTLSASYRYERDPRAYADPNYVINPLDDKTREQVSVSAQWPLTNKIYALGRYDYSIQEKRNTQSILGLEYKGECCWVGRVVMQRYAVSSQDVNTALFFQLELSGLGSLGTDPMRLLSDRIAGYRSITPPIPEKTTFERYE